ncbi:MAG: hypothetical protein E7157_01270 [Lactobacillales bacterium]|nr:hypothetical protein [Lactobacillales bacterium]
MHEIKLCFYDDCASYESDKQFYEVDKEDIIDDILKINHYSSIFKIKKSNKKTMITYRINSNDFDIVAIFPKRYIEENDKYFTFFNNLAKKQTKRKITYANIALISSVLAIGTWELAKRDFSIDQLRKDIKLNKIEKDEDYAIEQLDRELRIHTCNEQTDEGVIYPEYDHDCIFGDDKTTFLSDRIEDYCEKYLSNDEQFIEKIEQKFKLLYKDDLEEANKIDLNEEYDKVKTKK